MFIHGVNIDVPVTDKAVHKAELMKEDYIKIVFVSNVYLNFKAGNYVTYEGQNYYLGVDYTPSMTDIATFSYDLQFNAPWYNLDRYMFLFNTYNKDKEIIKRESEWSITDTAQNILSLIIRSVNENENIPCRFSPLFFCEPTVVKTFSFSSTSILAALNQLADEFEMEWWVTVEDGQNYLNFGECDNSIIRENGVVEYENGARRKDPEKVTTLKVGENIDKPSAKQKEDLNRYFYVYGSSRNIDQSIDPENIMTIATKRLTLDPCPFVWEQGNSGEEVVVFDDIYPKSDYQITGVSEIQIKTDDVAGYDKDGNEIYKTYPAYNLQIKNFSDFVFDLIEKEEIQTIEDIVASGKPLSLKFITHDDTETRTPKLAGFEFELGAILVTDEKTSDRHYEFQIIAQNINGYIIPNESLKPQAGDWVCIFNIKGKYIDGNELNKAQRELSDQFQKYLANKKKNVSFTVKPFVDSGLNLNIGDAVKLHYGQTIVSRINAFEKHLDYPIDASYDICSYTSKGIVNTLKDEVKSLTAVVANGGNIDTQELVNIIQLYGKRYFLSNVYPDTAKGLIDFARGFTAGGANGLKAEKDNSGNWHFETDYLKIRKKLEAEEIEIMHSSHIGGRQILSPASMKISEVVDQGDYWECFMVTEQDGWKIENTFQEGDLAYCEMWGLSTTPKGTSNHFYWRLVVAAGYDVYRKQNYVALSKSDCAVGSDAPMAGDSVTSLGNKTDSSRRGALILSGAGEGSPSICAYNGIRTYTLPSPIAKISPAEVAFTVKDKDGNYRELTELVDSLQETIESSGLDKQFVIWFGDYVPTLENEPASGWTDYEPHLHDIFYDRRYAELGGGKAYTFENNDGYAWVELTDKDMLAALETASRAKDTADSKRRVFTGEPCPPYDEGDMWVNAKGTYGDLVYDNDILTCKRKRLEGEQFDITDWSPAQEFTTSKIQQLPDEIIMQVGEGLDKAGIDIKKGNITLTADTTAFKTSDGVQVAGFTEKGLQANAISCRDGGGSTRVILDDDGLRYYYPNGKVMKEEVMKYDADGSLAGAETRYYGINGNLIWTLDTMGNLNKNTLIEYWVQNGVYYLESFPPYKTEGGRKFATTGEWLHIGLKDVNGILSKFCSSGGDHAQYNEKVILGAKTSEAPPERGWFSGYVLDPRSSRKTDEEYVYMWTFAHYENGVCVDKDELYFRDDI